MARKLKVKVKPRKKAVPLAKHKAKKKKASPGSGRGLVGQKFRIVEILNQSVERTSYSGLLSTKRSINLQNVIDRVISIEVSPFTEEIRVLDGSGAVRTFSLRDQPAEVRESQWLAGPIFLPEPIPVAEGGAVSGPLGAVGPPDPVPDFIGAGKKKRETEP